MAPVAVIQLCHSEMLQMEDAWTVWVKEGVKSKDDEFQEKVHPEFRVILVGGAQSSRQSEIKPLGLR